MYISIYVYTHIRIYLYTSIHIYVYTYIRIYVYKLPINRTAAVTGIPLLPSTWRGWSFASPPGLPPLVWGLGGSGQVLGVCYPSCSDSANQHRYYCKVCVLCQLGRQCLGLCIEQAQYCMRKSNSISSSSSSSATTTSITVTAITSITSIAITITLAQPCC